MQFDYSRVGPYVIAALTVLLVYRRLRRSFGRQRLRPVRMRLRIGILVLLGCSLLPAAMRSGQFLTGELVGIVVGIGLGVWGVRHTKYQTFEGQLHYIPHTYTGLVVSLLFVGRLAYRVMSIYAQGHADGQNHMDAMQGLGSPTMMKSPLTVGLLFVVVGYYVCYYSMVLWKSKRISPEDLEVASASTAASP
jgi:hypothetical protein